MGHSGGTDLGDSLRISMNLEGIYVQGRRTAVGGRVRHTKQRGNGLSTVSSDSDDDVLGDLKELQGETAATGSSSSLSTKGLSETKVSLRARRAESSSRPRTAREKVFAPGMLQVCVRVCPTEDMAG